MTNFRAREWSRITQDKKVICEEGMESLPVSLSNIASRLGIPVIAATLPPGISGEIRPSANSDSGYEIRVNRHDSKPRQRFTVAHEIAHYLLHEHLIGDGIRDSVLYRSAQSSAVEAEANRIAADLVMPANTIDLWKRQRRIDTIDDRVVEDLAIIAKVSKPALKIRYGI